MDDCVRLRAGSNNHLETHEPSLPRRFPACPGSHIVVHATTSHSHGNHIGNHVARTSLARTNYTRLGPVHPFKDSPAQSTLSRKK